MSKYHYHGLTIDIQYGHSYWTKAYDSEKILIEQLTKRGRGERHLAIYKNKQDPDYKLIDNNPLVFVGHLSHFNRGKKIKRRNG